MENGMEAGVMWSLYGDHLLHQGSYYDPFTGLHGGYKGLHRDYMGIYTGMWGLE